LIIANITQIETVELNLPDTPDPIIKEDLERQREEKLEVARSMLREINEMRDARNNIPKYGERIKLARAQDSVPDVFRLLGERAKSYQLSKMNLFYPFFCC